MSKIPATKVQKLGLMLGLITMCASLWTARADEGGPKPFASPEEAVGALIAAARGDDASELLKIFGHAGVDLISSGDPIADKEARAHFVERYGQGNKIMRDASDKATLLIGAEEWPFPIPIVQKGGAWHFDAQAGAQEIINRRIGRNELNAIEVCRSYVQAQRDYAADLESEKKPLEYAQKFVSDPGQHNGLYWPVRSGEKQSPIGPQMASARAEGYGRSDEHDPAQHSPYHGYYYKILVRQGMAAPGGSRDYVVAGQMTGGFALVAYPAKYGDSGVMSFIVNQDGIVYEKDLGRKTTTVAAAITQFNPDPTWKTR